jgi:ABC-2 type transport system permease protein
VLWYKAWLETRARFLASLAGITAVVVLTVHHIEYVFRPVGLTGETYLTAVRRNAGEIFRTGQHTLVGIWLLAVILLGMGGLIRERAVGASSLTLALPISRRRLVSTQAAVSVLEAISLAVFPWIAILLTMKLGGLPVSFSQAAFYLGLLTSGGLTYLGLSVLVSSSIEGEYTAPAVAYGLTFFSLIVCASVESIRPYADLWRFMGGDNHFSESTSCLVGPFPWVGALAALFGAIILLMASVVVIERREF